MRELRMERRLAANLAADVVGYSRLVGEHEEGALESLKVGRHTVADPLLLTWNGNAISIPSHNNMGR